MTKRLILILSLVLGIGLIASFAYAEVQSIKVSGDLTTLGVSRYGFNLVKPETDASGIIAAIRIRFDADLTDNVAVCVRLLNERVWGSDNASTAQTDNDIDLDLAYVTLKEFLYSPLTLMLGRQEVRLGSGLLVGDPFTNRTANATTTNLPAQLRDLTSSKAFDAIIGVLDYSPLTLTLGYLTIDEDSIMENLDNTNVLLANAAYDFGNVNVIGELNGELYYVLTDQGKNQGEDIGNIGVRLVSSPTENLGVSAEFAHQRTGRPNAEGAGHRNDYALLVGATYKMSDVKYTPSIGIDYTRLTADWDAMYEDQTPADIANALFTNSNLEIIGITATAKPMDDVALRLRLANLRSIRKASSMSDPYGGTAYSMDSGKDSLGNEVDLGLTYDYTEDVQLGLNLGYFDTGKAFDNREDAAQVIGSMKVTF